MDARDRMFIKAVKSLEQLEQAQGYLLLAQVETAAGYAHCNFELLLNLVNYKMIIKG